MRPDLQKYLPYVEEFDLTEEQKVGLIHTVWSIMESFVDRGFGQHPVQQCRAALPPADSNEAAEELGSEGHFLSDDFKDAGTMSGEGQA